MAPAVQKIVDKLPRGAASIMAGGALIACNFYNNAGISFATSLPSRSVPGILQQSTASTDTTLIAEENSGSARVDAGSTVFATALVVAGATCLHRRSSHRRAGSGRVASRAAADAERATEGSNKLRREVGAATAAALLGSGASASSAVAKSSQYPIVGTESIMKKKQHGTTPAAVQNDLRWGVDRAKADEICSFNRDYAEFAGYWKKTSFIQELREMKQDNQDAEPEITFYDSVTGKPLFVAPRGRSVKDFLNESNVHGWPSFRDQEVVWENTRCLPDGEAVSLDGTHLGHNIPDFSGNRYCINLVSVAGRPVDAAKTV